MSTTTTLTSNDEPGSRASIRSKANPKPARATSKPPPPPPRPAISEKAIDDELALLEKKLGK